VCECLCVCVLCIFIEFVNEFINGEELMIRMIEVHTTIDHLIGTVDL